MLTSTGVKTDIWLDHNRTLLNSEHCEYDFNTQVNKECRIAMAGVRQGRASCSKHPRGPPDTDMAMYALNPQTSLGLASPLGRLRKARMAQAERGQHKRKRTLTGTTSKRPPPICTSERPPQPGPPVLAGPSGHFCYLLSRLSKARWRCRPLT
jgi:hypothetical protein